LASGLGKGMNEFRKAADDIKREFSQSAEEIREDLSEMENNIRQNSHEIGIWPKMFIRKQMM
jgi:sec-independent protein translocase protein TatA